MQFLIILTGIALLIALITARLNPALALLITAVVTGLLLHMPFDKVMSSVNNGIGNTMSSLVMILALGGMFGKIIEESGAAQKIVTVLTGKVPRKRIQWALLLTGLITGIPLFYNAGFVILVPLVFTIAAATGLPLLYVGIPLIASLSITHGFLPPHPGPAALIGVFGAGFGKTLLYGLLLTVPIAIITGIVYPRLITATASLAVMPSPAKAAERPLPSAGRSFMVALLPVVIITIGTLIPKTDLPLGQILSGPFRDATLALLVSVFGAIALLRLSMARAMGMCTEGVKGIAMILIIIACGGAFKQILIDSGTGDAVAKATAGWHLSPLFLGWLITALLRLAIGSATISALTASGIMLPFLGAGTSPELMVLAVGAGSLMGSHVNDTGFWMFKEYFGLTLKQTLGTWTVMESLISVLGLAGVLVLSLFVK